MQTNLKRLSLALLALGLSAPAFADNCVMVPSQQGGFKVGIDALYLRANNSDLDFASVITTPGITPAFSTVERNISVDPSYDWGFYAQIGYLVPCTGNDITLGYTYLRSDETSSVAAGTFVTGVGPVVSLLPIGDLPFAAAAGKTRFDLNVVDLEGGQRFTTGCYDMRMFAGLRYANLDHNLSSVASPFPTGTVGVNTTSSFTQEYKSNFRGIGPRLGIDGRYCLNSGFGVDANLSTALLVGTVDGRYNSRLSTLGTTVVTSDFAVRNRNKQRVIPVLEAKLGVDYTHVIDCRCKSSIVFEAGYQVTNYFNAVDRPTITSDNLTTSNTLLAQGTNTDVAFDGPYLGVKYYA